MPRPDHQLFDNDSLIAVWIELSELSTASQLSHSDGKSENKVWIVQMFFESDMIIDQNVKLYFCKYLIDFTSKLCAKNFALIIKESPLNHGCSNAKILRFIFINPNREWNEKTCQCSRLRTDQWFVSKCVSPENVFCFLSVPTETADIGIIKQPVPTLEELWTSPKA